MTLYYKQKESAQAGYDVLGEVATMVKALHNLHVPKQEKPLAIGGKRYRAC